MKVIKRDGRAVDFDREKIAIAIEKANVEVKDKEKATKNEIKEIIEYIEDIDKKRILVEDIQDIIEQKLMEIKRYNLAKKYIVYRYTRALVRRQNTTDESILGLIKNSNKGVIEGANSKKHITISTQRDLIAGEVSKDLTRRILLPDKISKANAEGILYFHNSDYFLQPMFNSCIIDIGDMLDNGTVINGVKIDSPESFQTACIVMAKIIEAVASSQYGKQAIDIKHLGKYLRKSYNKYKNEITEKYRNKLDEKIIKELVQDRLEHELESGVQTIIYQINTSITTNGTIPATTIFLNLEENHKYNKENALIVEEFINQTYKGIKNEQDEYVTPEFPKLVYVLYENSKYEDLTNFAQECSEKTGNPKFISSKKMKENFEGKFDQGVVSINLSQIGDLAEKDEDEFWDLLNKRAELCREALMYRHYALVGTYADISPILWRHGAISRLEKGARIDKLLKDGYSTLTLSYKGLSQASESMFEDEKKKQEFETKIIKFLKNKTIDWKKETGIGFHLSKL